MIPSSSEVDEVLNVAAEAEEKGKSAYPGMTYEQGVSAAIRWMRGEEPLPLGEEA